MKISFTTPIFFRRTGYLERVENLDLCNRICPSGTDVWLIVNLMVGCIYFYILLLTTFISPKFVFNQKRGKKTLWNKCQGEFGPFFLIRKQCRSLEIERFIVVLFSQKYGLLKGEIVISQYNLCTKLATDQFTGTS